MALDREWHGSWVVSFRPIILAGDDGTSHALIVARTRTSATCRELPVPAVRSGLKIDPRHPGGDRFVILRFISAIQESGMLSHARTSGSRRTCRRLTAAGGDDPIPIVREFGGDGGVRRRSSRRERTDDRGNDLSATDPVLRTPACAWWSRLVLADPVGSGRSLGYRTAMKPRPGPVGVLQVAGRPIKREEDHEGTETNSCDRCCPGRGGPRGGRL